VNISVSVENWIYRADHIAVKILYDMVLSLIHYKNITGKSLSMVMMS
jgi:hypothetical protein